MSNYTRKMSETIKNYNNPVMIQFHPRYKGTNMSNQVTESTYFKVKLDWDKLFKLLGLYQKYHGVLSLYKCDPKHSGKRVLYEIEVTKKGHSAPSYYTITIAPLGETVISEDDKFYFPSRKGSVKARPLYDSFVKFKGLLVSILSDEYKMTAKDMKDCNYLSKLINKLEKKK